MINYLLCCDWGTSSFRLKLVNLTNQEIIDEINTDNGILNTFNAWKAAEKKSNITREQFYRDYLKKQTNVLALKTSLDLENISILISGMASSSIGIKEISYAPLPFNLDGSNANIMRLNSQKGYPNEIILISGVQSDSDVMRGEETQLIGLNASPSVLEDKLNDAILIFPGTHSKHIFLKDGQLVKFQTFMTGEVHNLMANYSILKQSVEGYALDEFSQNELDGFKLGIEKSQTSNILNSLFTVRTNELFNKLDKNQNLLYLSGLLIGTELKYLKQKLGFKLILCSGSNLYELYKLAFQELGFLDRTLIISNELIDKAALIGQIRICQNKLSI